MGKRGRRRRRGVDENNIVTANTNSSVNDVDENINDDSENRNNNRNPRKCSIAIIGSGLTGLATAILLATKENTNNSKRCIDIYERDESFEARKEGYGLTLTYNPTGILQQLGVLNDIADEDCPSRSHYLFKQNESNSSSSGNDNDNNDHFDGDGDGGEIIGYYGNDFMNAITNDHDNNDDDRIGIGGFGQRGNLRVPRQKVRQILLQRLHKMNCNNVRIHWNYKLNNIVASDTDVTLYFENGIQKRTGLVIAADGIHSSVVKCYLPNLPPPESLGVRIILGITGQEEDGHDQNQIEKTVNSTESITNEGANNRTREPSSSFRPDKMYPDLFNERGFYTLAQYKRLFVMPFSKATIDNPNAQPRYMWQLSFHEREACSGMNDRDNQVAEATTSTSNNTITTTIDSNTKSSQLQKDALKLTKGWHEPVQEMIQATPLSTIWGTLLLDRDPNLIQTALLQQPYQRIIVAGDALHAMSPFKGQGANNCLRDAQTIVKWFGSFENDNDNTNNNSSKKMKTPSSSFAASIKGCMRELVQRTAPIVQASRQAAQFWHSKDQALHEEHKFAGIENQVHLKLLQKELRRCHIIASSSNLTNTIRSMIQELCVSENSGHSIENLADSRDSSITKDTNTVHYVRKKKKNKVELSSYEEMEKILTRAYHAASSGDLGVLRNISWFYPNMLRQDSYKFILENGKKYDSSIKSVSENHSSDNTLTFAILTPTAIRSGSTINITNTPKQSTTCLHTAVTRGDLKVIHWLVTEAGCTIDALDANGKTLEQVTSDDAVQRLLARLRTANGSNML